MPGSAHSPSPNHCPGSDLEQWRRWAIAQGKTAQVPPLEVDWFLQGVSDLSALSLRLGSYRQRARVPLRYSLAVLTEKWQQRLEERVPVQYLVGETPWREWLLTVTPDVLIPRPETELMIDLVATAIAKPTETETGVWVDLGTGSGAIAISLAHLLPHARIIAVDASAAALTLAQHNADRNGYGDRIEFRQGSWFEPLTDLTGQLAGMVANPPYIPSQTVEELSPEVTDHEPHLALDGGHDGLTHLRTLITQAPIYLQPGGLWLSEIMAGQSSAVMVLLKDQAGYDLIQTEYDLAGFDRFVMARAV